MARWWLSAWALGSVAFGGASLLVPLYVVELGGDALDLGVLAAVAAFVGVPAAIVVGRRADLHGRRRRYVIAVLGALTGVLAVLPLLEAIPAVIAANGIIWLGFAAAMPVLTLLAVAEAPAYAWGSEIARLNKYQGAGWALGLAIGTGWTAVVGVIVDPTVAIQTCFWALAALAGGGLVAGIRTLPADPIAPEPVSGPRLRSALRRTGGINVRAATFPITVARVDLGRTDPRRLIDRFTPSLALYFIAITAMFAGFSAFFAPLPAFLTDQGLASDGVFALYLVSSVASAVCFGAVGRLASRYDVTMLQAAGLVLRGLAFPAVALAGIALGTGFVGVGSLVVLFAIIGVSWAVITVTAGTIVTVLAPVAIRGEALGLYAALTALAGGIGAMIGGYLGAIDYLVAFATAGVLALIGAAMVFGLRRLSPSEPN